jgi:hypothetical protein
VIRKAIHDRTTSTPGAQALDTQGAAATKNVSPIAWRNINLHGRYEFLKQIVLLNVDIIVQGLAGMPIDRDITLAA